MRLFPHLWQRVFLYAILLVLVSHVISFMMFRFSAVQIQHVRILTEIAANAAAALEGKDEDSAAPLLEFFSQGTRKLWLERLDGTVFAGEPLPDLTAANRAGLPFLSGISGKGIVRKSKMEDDPYFAEVPIHLAEGEARIFVYLGGVPSPPMSAIFIQGLIAVCIIGGVLSVWVTWRIARPLRRLRTEVLAIADGNLDFRVSEQGSEEIIAVASAVNNLSHNLARNIRGMRELVANISHEMRSPLARMSFSVAIIEEGLHALSLRYKPVQNQKYQEDIPQVILDGDGRPLAMKHVANLAQEIAHMENLIGSSLLSSRLDLQQETPITCRFDISCLCRQIAQRHEALLSERKLAFVCDIQPELWVDGDEHLLSLVISNLLDNAWKYTTEDGTVRMRMYEEQAMVCLSLENSHPWIAEEVLPQLFQPFFRGGQATADGSGVGLGLYLVEKIVASHQGSISVENCEGGIRFIVRIPSTQPENPEFVDWFFSRHAVAEPKEA